MMNLTAMAEKASCVACGACPIRFDAFCAKCDPEAIAVLERIKSYRTYEKGETVALQGFETPFIASVVSGAAAMTRTLEDGRTQMVALLLPSDLVGNPAREIAVHTVTAMSSLKLCCFDRRIFLELVGSYR